MQYTNINIQHKPLILEYETEMISLVRPRNLEVFKKILDKQWNPKPNNYHGSTAIFIFEWFIPPAISPLLQGHKWGTVKSE